MISGQINTDSLAGQTIISVCNQDNINTIVEIGTWNGMGSTKCIDHAIITTNKKAISIEANLQKHLEAKNNLCSHNVELLYGKVTDKILDINQLPDYFFTDYSRQTKMQWLHQDNKSIQEAPNILHILPDQIDLLILDGGEFSSYFEYLLLKDRSKYIFLDDTSAPTIKNYHSRLDMIKNHTTLIDQPSHRNGFYLGLIK